MTYQRTAQIIALALIFGFLAITGWAMWLGRNDIKIVLGLVGGINALAVLAVKEFFGAPGPSNGSQGQG